MPEFYMIIAREVFSRFFFWGGGDVADPAMGGPGGPPIDRNLGLVMAARLRLGGKFSPKSITFGHIFVYNCTKSFQLQEGFASLTPHQGLCP